MLNESNRSVFKSRNIILAYTLCGLTFVFIIVTSVQLLFHLLSQLLCHSNATFIFKLNKTGFFSKCICNFGLTGDGKTYCDPCGGVVRDFIHSNHAARIIGGHAARPQSWPFAVYIQYPNTNITCGGVLINRKTILSAAHCFMLDDKNANDINVYVGLHSTSQLKELEKLKIESIILHPDIDSYTYLNDLAIIRLADYDKANSFDRFKNVSFACLPSFTMQAYPESKSIFSGWTIGWGVNQTKELNEVELDVLNMKSCRYTQYSLLKTSDQQICAGMLDGGKDACQGDSGNGFYVVDSVGSKNRVFTVAGLVSYGYKCGLPNRPSIYTRVSYYLEWIYTNGNF